MIALGSTTIIILLTLILADKIVMPLLVHGDPIIRVPNVIGMTVNEAKFNLEARGLSVQEIRQVFSDKVEQGHVINQLPYPNTEVKKGRRLYLTVSKGSEKLKMPMLVGKTERDARLLLLSIGLQPGDISESISETMAPGLIIAQSIPAGADALYGQQVSLVISSGNASIIVPQLIGHTIDEARIMLEESGLVLGPITRAPSNDTFMSNTVTFQIPSAGESLHAGDTVSVTITE
jgi:serine/threonine-protein kinase